MEEENKFERSLRLVKEVQNCQDIERRKILEEELIVLNEKLIWYVINRTLTKKRFLSMEEAFSSAVIAFRRAVYTYDPDRGKFPSFAYLVIRRDLQGESRERGLIAQNEISLDSTPKFGQGRLLDGEESKGYSDILASDCDPIKAYYNKELRENIIKILDKKCTPIQSYSIKNYYGLNDQGRKMSLTEIGEEKGVTRQFVSFSIKKGFKKIKNAINAKYKEEDLTF